MKIVRIIKFIVYVTLGILIAIFSENILSRLDYYLAGLLFLYSVEAIIYSIYYHPKTFYHHRRFFWGISEIILGFVLIFQIDVFEYVCVVWAVWSILREAEEIRESIVDFKHYLTSIPSLIESIANMVLSIMLIMDPSEHHAKIHLYFLISELVLASGLPLINAFYYKQKEIISEQI